MSQQKKSNDPSNPWSFDYFNPPSGGGVQVPAGPARRLRPIPDQDTLFAIQKNLVKAVNALDDLEHDMVSQDKMMETANLRKSLESGYKSLVKYLKEFSTS